MGTRSLRAGRVALVAIGLWSPLVACSALLGDFTVGPPVSPGPDGEMGEDAADGSPGDRSAEAMQPGESAADAEAGPSDVRTEGTTAPPDSGAPGDASMEGTTHLTEAGADAGSDGEAPDGAAGDAPSCGPVTADPANCGACGHSCGGGQCVGGICQPATVLANIDAPLGMDVDPNGVYFTVDGAVKSCPLTGCVSLPTQIGGGFASIGPVAAVSGNVVFQATAQGLDACEGIYVCPTTACPSPSVFLAGGGIGAGGGGAAQRCPQFQGLVSSGSDVAFIERVPPVALLPFSTTLVYCNGVAASGCAGMGSDPANPAPPFTLDPQNGYYVATEDASMDIVACPADVSCAPPTQTIGGGDASAATVFALPTAQPGALVARGGTLYLTMPQLGLLLSAGVYTCPVTGCSSLTTFGTTQSMPQSLAVDQDGVYFVVGSSVYSCPLAGCGGVGPRLVIGNQAAPALVRTDAAFVYWVNQGASDGDGGFVAGTAAILRIAK